MQVRRYAGSPAVISGRYSAGLPVSSSLTLPTCDEAREKAETAIAVGTGMVIFGFIVLALLPQR